jgi:DAK2 domain fusion protein YloV
VRQTFDAEVTRAWLTISAAQLHAQREAIDDINVFPVPDGDTGTNLAATIGAAAEALNGAAAQAVGASRGASASAGDLLKAATQAAVLNARGNSGVIVSQFLRGFAENVGLGDAAALLACLRSGAELAEAAVVEPKAGTMLSVMHAAARAEGQTLADLVADATARAGVALAHTPEQLPELARAGVVDAGGRGVLVLLQCLEAAVTGIAVVAEAARTVRSARALTMAREVGSPEFAFEVQYLLDCAEEDAVQLRSELSGFGDSVLVVGTGTGTWNVHAHVNDVGATIEAGLERGRIRRVSVLHFADQPRGDSVVEESVLLIALTPPDGLAGLFESEGVLVVTPAELSSAIGTSRRVILFPATNSASVDDLVADLRRGGTEIAVVPTRSVLQALAAIAVHDDARRFQDDVIAMAEAAAGTRFAEIRVAEDDALTSVGPCRRGDVLGLIDGDVVHIGAALVSVAVVVTDRLLGTGGELITVLVGADSPDGAAQAVAEHVAAVAAFTEVVVYDAGQRDCPLMIGME